MHMQPQSRGFPETSEPLTPLKLPLCMYCLRVHVCTHACYVHLYSCLFTQQVYRVTLIIARVTMCGESFLKNQ